MLHKTVSVVIFAFAIGLVGCRACWGPYDHCQPTFVPEAGDTCMGELYRNGLILGGMERRCNESGCGSCAACGSGGVSNAGYTEFLDDGQNAPAGYYESIPEDGTLPEAPSTTPLKSEPLPIQTNRVAGSRGDFTQTSFPEQFPLADGEGDY